MKTCIVICSRVQSKRLKRKVLLEINGKKLIEILIENLMSLNSKYPVILAIPNDSENNILETIGDHYNIQVYRGNDTNPMERLYNASEGFDNVVRITHDDILIDAYLLERQIYWHEKGFNKYTFMKRCPDGIAGEIIDRRILERALEETDHDVEHVSYYVKKHVKASEFFPAYEYQNQMRLTIDYKEDYELVNILYKNLATPFGTLDIINFLRRNRYLLEINKLPAITVYTVNYNYSDYIIECAESVLNQSFDDFEYIILDDCSTDDSVNKLTTWFSNLDEEKQNKVKILRQGNNKGLPSGCNDVLNVAKGKYICRVDSDDLIDKTFLFELHAEIEFNHKKEDFAAIFSGYRKVDKQGKQIEEVNKNDFHPACCLLLKCAVNEIKYNENLEHFEGVEFFNRFNKHFNHLYYEKPLWSYRRHEDQKSSDKNKEVREEVLKKIV